MYTLTFKSLRRISWMPPFVLWMSLCTIAALQATPLHAQDARRVTDGFVVEIEHRFEIRGGNGLFEIENYAGDVDIEGSTAGDVIVTEFVRVEAGDEQEARTRASQFFSDVSQIGSSVRLRGAVRHGDDLRLRVRLAKGMSSQVSSIHGDVSLKDSDGSARLGTGSGDIVVERLSGELFARTGSGDVDISDADGPVHAVSGAGDVTLQDVRNDIDIATGAGDLDLTYIQGNVEVATGGGDILIEGVDGDVLATTAGGDVDLEDVTGNAELSTSGGSIEISRLSGNLLASTLGGDIGGTEISGTVTVETMAGDIDFLRVINQIVARSEVGEINVTVLDASFLRNGRIDLRAENGDIALRLPREANAEILIDLGFDGEFDEDRSTIGLRWTDRKDDVRQGRVRRISGRLNQGGGLIELHTASGEVVLTGQ